MKRQLRIWAIKKGLIRPSSTAETREIFPFPLHRDIKKPRHNNMQDWLRLNIIDARTI